LPLLAAPADDVLVRPLIAASLLAEGWLTPGRLRTRHTNRRAALTTTMRVRSRVHCRTTYRRAPAEPALAASRTELDVAVLGVADLPDGRAAVLARVAPLAARQAERGMRPVLRQERCGRARRARRRRALAGVQLNGVHHRTDRDVAQRQRVAGAGVGALARHDGVADTQAERRNDVALLAIGVDDQGDTGRAVRVVLDGRDAPRYAILITLEVDQTVAAAVTTST